MCGVSVRTTSVVVVLVVVCETSRPITGMSPIHGIVSRPMLLSVRKRPARKLVSPSFSRMLAATVRVPMVGWPAEFGRGDLRDLELELERDLLVVVHAGLDLDLDADVLVLEGRDVGREVRAAAADHGNVVDRDRHLVADEELRLLSLGHPQLRLRQQLRRAVVLDEVELRGRQREAEGVDVELLELAPGERARADGRAAGWSGRCRATGSRRPPSRARGSARARPPCSC